MNVPSLFDLISQSNSRTSPMLSPSTSSSANKKKCDVEDVVDRYLLEAMVCPICQEILDDPRQLECGHSLCASCAGLLFSSHPIGRHRTCPICRCQFIAEPTVNYALKGLISRIKEKGAMAELCFDCSKAAQIEAQYCCDDCDHKHKEQHIICAMCAINKHAKKYHHVSKFEETKERLKSAREEMQNITSEMLERIARCQEITEGPVSCAEHLFEILHDHCAKLEAVEMTLADDKFVSKKDVEIKLLYARRVRESFISLASHFERLVTDFLEALSKFAEQTSMEMAGIITFEKEMKFKPEKDPPSWFEYRRKEPPKALESAAARRNAKMLKMLARRHTINNPPSTSPASSDVPIENLTIED